MSHTIVSVILFHGEDMENDFHNIMDDMDYEVNNTQQVTVNIDDTPSTGIKIQCEMYRDDELEFTDKAQRRMEDSMGIEFVYGISEETEFTL